MTVSRFPIGAVQQSDNSIQVIAIDGSRDVLSVSTNYSGPYRRMFVCRCDQSLLLVSR